MKNLLLLGVVLCSSASSALAGSILNGNAPVANDLETDMHPRRGDVPSEIFMRYSNAKDAYESKFLNSPPPIPTKYEAYFGNYQKIPNGKIIVRVWPKPEAIVEYGSGSAGMKYGSNGVTKLAIPGNTFTCVMERKSIDSLTEGKKYSVSMVPLEVDRNTKVFGSNTNLLISNCTYKSV